MIWLDLTGQRVRGETKQYTGTDFGYIQGKLACLWSTKNGGFGQRKFPGVINRKSLL